MAVCPSCGALHDERARFCAECGAALAPAPVPGEVRKLVTVLFSDVTGSTSLAERLDPEAVRRLMGRYFETARTVIERHGGTVEKYIGDAVMAVFGVPVVHEDDALRAVRAGDELAQALRALDTELSPSGVSLGVRIGIETGEVVAGLGSQGTTLVTGDTVNVAARLEQAAAPGEVIIGTGTHGLVRDIAVVEPLEPLALKGKAGPVAAFRLVSVSATGLRQHRRSDVRIVGRDRELAVLRQAFAGAVRDRSPRLFTLFGAAGVGKSRLVREFVTEIGPDAQVLEGRCLPYGDGITYWPLVEIVRASAGIADDDRAEVARGRIDRLLGDAPGAEKIATGIAQVVGLEGGQASENEVFSAVRGFLRSLAGDRPLVVVFEDVHWAEPTLLDLIDDIVAAGGEAAILLVALARPDLLDRRLEWTGRPESRSLVLETLPSDDADRLLAGLLPGAALPDPLRAVLETAGEGNPLFLEELVGMLVDDGRLRRAGDEWVVAGKIEDLRIPPTINALLGARLDGLAPEVRAVAGRASVIGRVFDRDALVAVSPDGEREATPGSLTVLASAELVEPVPGGPGATFQFRHVLIRDAAYWSLPKATRADLHERLAGWIERSSGDRLGEVEEIVGYHFEAAHRWRSDLGTLGDGGDELAAQAAEHLAAASRRAVARSDSRAAANLLTRTAALLRPDDPARGPLLIDLGLALLNIGESLRADAALDEVEALADASGDRLMRAHAVVQRWLGSDGTHGRMAEARPDALDALARFEAAGDELGQARAWRLLSEIEWAEGHGAASEAANTNDLAHARRSGRPREATEAYCILSGILNTGPISVTDGIAHAEAILEREAGNGPVEGWLCHGLAHLRARRGEFAEARALAARSDASLLRHGQSYEAAIQSELWGDLELLAGDAPAAVLVLKAGFQITERSGRPSLMLAAFLSQAAVAANQPAEAEAAADQAIAGGGWIRAIAQGALGRVRAGQGRLAEAELLTAEAVAYFEQTDFLTFRARACLDRADVLRRSGRWADAVAAATLARELHRRKGSDLEADRAELVLRELESAAAEVRAPAG